MDLPVGLAVITKNIFNQGWCILDWRFSKDDDFTPFLADGETINTLRLNKENLKLAETKLSEFWIDGDLIYWRVYDISLIKEFSKSREYNYKSVWKFREARDYLSETKKYWESFDGDDFSKTKIENKFYQSIE